MGGGSGGAIAVAALNAYSRAGTSPQSNSSRVGQSLMSSLSPPGPGKVHTRNPAVHTMTGSRDRRRLRVRVRMAATRETLTTTAISTVTGTGIEPEPSGAASPVPAARSAGSAVGVQVPPT